MNKVLNRLICLIKGHQFGFWMLGDCGDVVEYRKCQRCGRMPPNDKVELKEWIDRCQA